MKRGRIPYIITYLNYQFTFEKVLCMLLLSKIKFNKMKIKTSIKLQSVSIRMILERDSMAYE